MSVEWDWMLRQAVEQAKTEGIDEEQVADHFNDLLEETYGTGVSK